MPEPLSRSDYEYILSSLKYARYAHESSEYPTDALKHQQLAHLDHLEKKLRALRDATEHRDPPKDSPELF